MPNTDMLDVTLSEIRGPFDSLWANICGPNGREVFEELKRFNRRDPCWVGGKAKPTKPKKAPRAFLERVGKPVRIPAISQFTAADKFRPGETVDGIKVAWLGNNFKKHLLPKIEDAVAAAERSVHKLLEDKRDPAIITALGGEEKVETSLGQFWEFLKTADQSFWYVAYIRDTDDVLWAVRAGWRDDGLDVAADPLGGPGDWDAGCRFLSC